MSSRIPYQDTLYRLAQVGDATGVQLVRIIELAGGNRYVARAVEFDENGATQYAEEQTLELTNLAEPPDSDGSVPSGTDAVALDIEGRWVAFLRPAGDACFPAKVVSSLGSAAYGVLEQYVNASGQFANAPGATTVAARNLAELSLGNGVGVDVDTIVLVTVLVRDGSPPELQYVFDHPVYARYLD